MKKIILFILLFILSFNIFAGEYYTNESYVYCIHKNHLDEIVEVVQSGDKELFQKMVKLLIASGTGGLLPQNKQVYINDRDYGYVKFHFKGEAQTYWTLKEGIKYRE